MKKIFDFLIGILLAIVYPNRILNLFRVRNLDQNSNKILGNDNVVKILAFIVAIVFVAVTRYTPATTNTHRQTFTGIPLEPYIGGGYTYWGSIIPTQITVVLTGDNTDITLLPLGSISAYIDLSGFGTGVHDDVVVNVVGVPDHIGWTAEPSMLHGIEIDTIERAEFRVRSLDRLPDLHDRYAYSEVSVDPEYVVATGPSRILAEIDVVLSHFDLMGMSLEPRVIVREGILVPMGSEELEPLGGIEFDPPTVNIQVEIFEDIRQIYIDVDENLTNVPPDQYEIISVTPDVDVINVWGDFDDMDEYLKLPPIGFMDLNDEGQISILIGSWLPEGVFTDTNEIVITVDYEELPEPVTEPEPEEEEEEEEDEDED